MVPVTADLDSVAIISSLRECFEWQLRICLTVRSLAIMIFRVLWSGLVSNVSLGEERI